MNIKKSFLKLVLVVFLALPIPFLKSINAQKQNIDSFSIHYKNKISAGTYLALGELGVAGDVGTLLYSNEYTRNFNRYFSLGVGIGFANKYKQDYSTVLDNGDVYTATSQASFVTINAVPYFNIIRTRRSLLSLGAGASFRLVTSLAPEYTLYYFSPEFPVLNTYRHEKVFEIGMVSGIEYGFRFTPHFISSIKTNMYFSGNKYSSSFLTIGFTIGYLF